MPDNSNQIEQKTDIVIVGAGLVGLSFALSLQHQALSIQMLETHLPNIIAQPDQDSRPISLSYGSQVILETLGVWGNLAVHACPIQAVHVSEKGRFGATHIDAKSQQVPALGYVVPFCKLQSALYEHVANQPNVTFAPIEKILKLKCDEQAAHVEIKTPKGDLQLEADLLVASDGTQSTCRSMLNIPTTQEDHGDIAHIYQLNLTEDHDHTAYERFTKYGVVAILPLPNLKTTRMVWTLSPRVVKKIENWRDADILNFLQDTFDGRLSIADLQKTASFPLQTIIAKKQIHESAVLLGNAAHTIYPLAAQGFNLGLRDVATLSETLIKAKKYYQRLGEQRTLQDYESWASKHQRFIINLTNHLSPLFELNLPVVSGLRGLGLLGLDLATPIKKRFAKRTMGIAGKLPRLARKIRLGDRHE